METGWERLKFCPRSFRHITSPCNVRQFVPPTNKTATQNGWLSSHFCVSETLDALGLSHTPCHFRLLCVSDSDCPDL